MSICNDVVIKPQLIIRHYHDFQLLIANAFSGNWKAILNSVMKNGSIMDLTTSRGTHIRGKQEKPEHILIPSDIQVQSDRGGQVTWHGPGQMVVEEASRLIWTVWNGTYAHLSAMGKPEQLMIDCWKYSIVPMPNPMHQAFVWTNVKLGSLGFKIRKGRSYHVWH